MTLDSGLFDYFNDTEAAVSVKADYDDVENEYTLKEIGQTMGNLQPYSGGLLEEEYGLRRECQKRFFCAADESITEGVYLTINGKSYEVIYAQKWETRMCVMLREAELYGKREQ